jgi:hypothetical protein
MDVVTFDQDGGRRIQSAVLGFEHALRNRVDRARGPVMVDGTQFFPAKITAGGTLPGLNPSYSWVEEKFLGDGTLGDLAGGRSGTWNDLNPAFELNLSPGVPAGTYVWMAAGNLNPNATIGQEYEFTATRTRAAWINFSLVATLAVTDASQAGCSVDLFWSGGDPGPTVTVYNQPAQTNYIFSGSSGKHGVAFYDPAGDKYWIVQMEC